MSGYVWYTSVSKWVHERIKNNFFWVDKGYVRIKWTFVIPKGTVRRAGGSLRDDKCRGYSDGSLPNRFL
jgi:hypothetical protein